jgi:hypothetical protein
MISEGFLLSSTAACILSYSICVSPIQQRHNALFLKKKMVNGIILW